VSVRLDLEYKEGLDELGERVKRDRSFLVNEAVAGYLARQR
jgi:predicted transcriptional regulator